MVTAIDVDDIMFPSENVTGKKPSKWSIRDSSSS